MNLTEVERRMFVGIDIGQVNDSTALAVVERLRAVPAPWAKSSPNQRARARQAAAEEPLRLNVRHVERLPLGILYPRQVEMIMERLQRPALRGATVYLDATGVGRPVLQMLRQAGARNVHGITITSAQSEARQTPDGWNVGKAELMNGALIAMQVGQLRLHRGVDHVDRLVKELRDFRARQNPTSGNMTFTAREGEHDDLPLALSYAVFGALRPEPATRIEARFAA